MINMCPQRKPGVLANKMNDENNLFSEIIKDSFKI